MNLLSGGEVELRSGGHGGFQRWGAEVRADDVRGTSDVGAFILSEESTFDNFDNDTRPRQQHASRCREGGRVRRLVPRGSFHPGHGDSEKPIPERLEQ